MNRKATYIKSALDADKLRLKRLTEELEAFKKFASNAKCLQFSPKEEVIDSYQREIDICKLHISEYENTLRNV